MIISLTMVCCLCRQCSVWKLVLCVAQQQVPIWTRSHLDHTLYSLFTFASNGLHLMKWLLAIHLLLFLYCCICVQLWVFTVSELHKVLFLVLSVTFLLHPQERLRSIVMSMSVSVSVCLSARYLPNHMRDLYQIFCACSYVRGSDLFWHVDDRRHRLSVGRGWWECTVRAKCTIALFCLCTKYPGNRWTDLCQIHMEDVFGSSLGWVWMSRSKVKVMRDKCSIFWPFGGLHAVCLVKYL